MIIYLNADSAYLANALRAEHARAGGAILVLGVEHADHDPRGLIGKLLRDALPPESAASPPTPMPDPKTLNWKKDPTVLCLGDGGRALLAKLDEFLPGFKASLGSAIAVNVDAVE